MPASPGLDAGLLVGADDEIALCERFSPPHPLVEVERPAGFARKVRVAGEYPAAVPPGAYGIFRKPAPEGGIGYLGHYPPLDGPAPYLGYGEAG